MYAKPLAPFLALALFAASNSPGCARPQSASPVIAAQREAIVRLEASYAQDLAAQRSLVETLLALRRQRLETRAELAAATREMTGETLGPDFAAALAEHDQAARALLASLDAHAADVALLFLDALASSEALAHFSSSGPALDAVSREAALQAWRSLLAHRIEDEAARAAADHLLERLLTLD